MQSLPVDVGNTINFNGNFGTNVSPFSNQNGGTGLFANPTIQAKPKGVGYSTGVGQTWDVNAYLKTK